MPADRLRVGRSTAATLELSNLDKVLYPAAGFTKGEVIDYYTRIAPVLLPHLADRPLTRIRYPNGVDGELVLREERARPRTPDWVRRGDAARARVDEGPGDHRLRGRRRPAHPGLAGQPGRAGAAHAAVEGRRTPGPDGRRPRPGRAGRAGRVLPGGGADARPARRTTASTRTRRRPARRACSSAARSPAPRPPTIVSGYARRIAAGAGAGAPEADRRRRWRRTCAPARSSSTGARTTRRRRRWRRTRCGPSRCRRCPRR